MHKNYSCIYEFNIVSLVEHEHPLNSTLFPLLNNSRLVPTADGLFLLVEVIRWQLSQVSGAAG